MKDRFSLHVHNGQTDIFEAITVLRNGGTASQSGLVGITNVNYQPTSTAIPSAILPETIFNIQSSGQSDVRFSSHGRYDKSNLQLFSNGNTLASGLEISYDPLGENGPELNTTDDHPSFSYNTNNPVVNFNLVRPSGGSGVKVGFMSVTESGFIGIGSTSYRYAGNESSPFTISEPLTVCHSGAGSSGTIALLEQASKPSTTDAFGKIYVKPSVVGVQTQSLYFLDDAGNEFDITKSRYDYFDGLLYGDEYGNTFGGWYTPHDRSERADRLQNTLVGYAAGALITGGDANAVFGYFCGSGMNDNTANTILGTLNYTHANDGDGNIIIGYKNSSPSDMSSELVPDDFSNVILMGTGLYVDSEPDNHTLAIGFGSSPLVLGSLGEESRRFSVKSTSTLPATLSVDGQELEFGFSNRYEDDYFSDDRKQSVIDIKDTVSNLDCRGMMSLRFSNSDDVGKTLMDFDPSGTFLVTPTFTEPTPRRPFVSVSGDVRLLGAIRFSDGSVLSNASNIDILATTGIKKVMAGDGNHYVHLYFADMLNATSLTPSFDTSTSTIAVEVLDGIYYKAGKMTLDSLTNYLASGYATAGENCNMIFTDNKYTVDTTKNSNSVFIGCDTASYATGWKHSVMIGTQAGYAATVPNASLETDTASIFIGHTAGYDADNVENSINIGNAAGKNSDSSSNSIFIGNSAGLNSTNEKSIGIGDFALDGDLSSAEGGINNIEIVAGLLSNQRLMYSSGHLNYRINIQNTIAGDTYSKFLSIGDARLAPESPLEVRRDIKLYGHGDAENIQTWFDTDARIGRFNASGDFVSKITPSGQSTMATESWFGNLEGFMDDYIYAPSSYDAPTSGQMTVKNSTFTSAEKIWVINRDPRLDIHGPGAVGGAAYVITTRVNGENRAIYVSCSGS